MGYGGLLPFVSLALAAGIADVADCGGPATGFIANYLRDRHLGRQAELPAWYLPLRLRLSAVACVCLGFAAFLNPF